MVNLTTHSIIFNKDGSELAHEIKDSLCRAAKVMMQAHGRETVAWDQVTVKLNAPLLFSKLVKTRLEKAPDNHFDRFYVTTMYMAAQRRGANARSEEWDTIACSRFLDEDSWIPFTAHKAKLINGSLQIVLVDLARKGVITLPYSFRYPLFYGPALPSKTELMNLLDGSDGLLRIVRNAQDLNSEFTGLDVLGNGENTRIDFESRCTRLLLALGWTRPEDASNTDVETLSQFIRDTEDTHRWDTYIRQMIQVFALQFGERFPVDLNRWDAFQRSRDVRASKAHRTVKRNALGASRQDVWKLRPRHAQPDVLRKSEVVSGTTVRMKDISETWLAIQEHYLKLVGRKKQRIKEEVKALGYFNIYLFYYLAYWFEDNKDTSFAFPSDPSKLIGPIFVSRVLPVGKGPMRFSEFIEFQSEVGGGSLSRNSIASILRVLEQFFGYIEKNSAHLPSSSGFVQPLCTFDYPRQNRPASSNKRAIPHSIFSLYLRYVECMVAYYEALLEAAVNGTLSQDALYKYFDTNTRFRDSRESDTYNVLDTFSLQDQVGFVPILFVEGTSVPLRYIPQVFQVDGKVPVGPNRKHLLIPRPHGLINVAVALYTGIRNQHIQWLDAERFDQEAQVPSPRCHLYVNTDKVKNGPWLASVNGRVISLLRIQKGWRDLVNYPSFSQPQYYENNKHAQVYAPFLPLFAYSDIGLPHGDVVYSNVWSKILSGVQGILREAGFSDGSFDDLCKLLPVGVKAGATLEEKLKQFGTVQSGFNLQQFEGELSRNRPFTRTRFFSEITPHSARVTVVTSHLMNWLEPELIGEYITGQKVGTVYYYFKPSDAQILELQKQQGRIRDKELVALHVSAIGKDMSATLKGFTPERLVNADSPESAFVTSIRSGHVGETLTRYGCITLVVAEQKKTGIDILVETEGVGASFNKCEVCPFGNLCPPDVVAKLMGRHRCGLCYFAVRSIDHLPAIVSKIRGMTDNLKALEAEIAAAVVSRKLTETELEGLRIKRQKMAEELSGYVLAEQALERQRVALRDGQDNRAWVTPEPEMLRKRLERIEVPTDETLYLLNLLSESAAYPSLDSDEMKAKFKRFHRLLLANTKGIRDALLAGDPIDPAAACISQLKVLADANGIAYEDIPLRIQEMNERLLGAPRRRENDLLEFA